MSTKNHSLVFGSKILQINVYLDAPNDDDAGKWNLFYDDASAATIVFDDDDDNDDDAGKWILFYDDASAAATIVFDPLILSIGLTLHCNKYFCTFFCKYFCISKKKMYSAVQYILLERGRKTPKNIYKIF